MLFGGVDTIHIAGLQLPYVYLPFPFSRNPVSSQYLEALLRYWLGLSLVPLSCPIPIASQRWRVVRAQGDWAGWLDHIGGWLYV